MTLWSTVIRGATSVENFFFIGFTIMRALFKKLMRQSTGPGKVSGTSIEPIR